MATVGAVSNQDHMNEVLGKAGRVRHKGRRPHVRGVAMNPVDHPVFRRRAVCGAAAMGRNGADRRHVRGDIRLKNLRHRFR